MITVQLYQRGIPEHLHVFQLPDNTKLTEAVYDEILKWWLKNGFIEVGNPEAKPEFYFVAVK